MFGRGQGRGGRSQMRQDPYLYGCFASHQCHLTQLYAALQTSVITAAVQHALVFRQRQTRGQIDGKNPRFRLRAQCCFGNSE